MAATKQDANNFYIAKDHEEPGKVAVYQFVERGTHPRVKGGFGSGESAKRWVEGQREKHGA